VANRLGRLAAALFLTAAILIPAKSAMADGYRGASFSADVWFGTEGSMKLRYRMYVGTTGYRLEAIKPVDGPDIIIAQFAVPQFVYIDRDTGAVNLLPMGDDDWGRFHGVACADFEYRKKLGTEEVSGRQAEVWQCIASKRYAPDTKIWWDPALRFQIRSDEQGYIKELRAIKPGEPDRSLFETPAAHN
jgi:hypothetical protein